MHYILCGLFGVVLAASGINVVDEPFKAGGLMFVFVISLSIASKSK